MINLAIHQHDADDCTVSQGATWLESRVGVELGRDVGGYVDQCPTGGIAAAHRDRGLGPDPGAHRPVTDTGAVTAVAVPLRKAATRCGPQHSDLHSCDCRGRGGCDAARSRGTTPFDLVANDVQSAI